MEYLRVGLIQMDSQNSLDLNLEKAERLILSAVNQGGEFILLPEVFNFRGSRSQMIEQAETIDGTSVSWARLLAKTHGVWILIGSFCEQTPLDDKRVYNTSVLINPSGEIDAIYRKMHLFEATVSGVHISEPSTFLAGDQPVLTHVKGVALGLSICFDLRFPELYQNYARIGARMCAVPSSFTRPTGESHWDILCRARAVDYQQFVLAPNQVGVGAGGVESYGHSMVVDPWGRVLVCGDGITESAYMATLDFNERGFYRKVPD